MYVHVPSISYHCTTNSQFGRTEIKNTKQHKNRNKFYIHTLFGSNGCDITVNTTIQNEDDAILYKILFIYYFRENFFFPPLCLFHILLLLLLLFRKWTSQPPNVKKKPWATSAAATTAHSHNKNQLAHLYATALRVFICTHNVCALSRWEFLFFSSLFSVKQANGSSLISTKTANERKFRIHPLCYVVNLLCALNLFRPHFGLLNGC